MYSRKLYVCLGIVVLFAAFLVAPGSWLRRSPGLFLSHSLIRQMIQGHLSGHHSGSNLPVDVNIAEPGDIILCHNARGAYGYWTHAVLYVGQARVVDANDFAHGTIIQDVSHYRNYDEVILLRPTLPLKLRQQAAIIACSKVGTPYDPLGSLQDSHSAYCSKLIWEAYAQSGQQLCKASGWILPDQVASSPHLTLIARWCTSQGDGSDVAYTQKIF